MYGARANNGVIIITTRQGKAGPPKVTYDAYYGLQRNGSPEIPTLTPIEEANLFFQKYQNIGQTPPTTLYGNGPAPRLPDYIWPAGAMEGDSLMQLAMYSTDVDDPQYGKTKFIITKANKEGTDWQKEVYRTAPIQSHNLTVSGGSDKSLYSLGMNYFDQQGIMLYSYFKRYSLRANSQFTVKNNIRLGENLQLSFSEQVSGTSGGGPISSSFVTVHHTPAIVPVYDIQGNWASGKALGLGQNPVAQLTRNKDNTGRNLRLLGNVFAKVTVLKDFVARTSLGGQYEIGWIRNFTHRAYESVLPGLPGSDSYTEASNYNSTWAWTNTLTYAHTFGSLHRIKVLVGTEAIRDEGRTLAASRTSYYSDDPLYRTLNSGEKNQTNGGGAFSSSLYSLFGRAEYSYADKYLLTATLRRDGSSRIGYKNPYGVFPALSVGWRLSEEPFMQRLPFLQDLKLRAGWGQTGNQAIDPANSYSTFSASPAGASYDIHGTSTSAVRGVALNRFGDPNVKWETQTSTNAGVDASFWRGTLDVALDLYYRRTKDLLYQQPFPGTAGLGAVPFVNVGDMQNKGVEVSLTYRGKLAGDWKWELGLNLTHYRNKILRVGESDSAFFGVGENRSMKGHPMSSFYGYVIDGIFQSAEEIDSAATQDGISKERPDPFTEYTLSNGTTTRGMGIGRFRFRDVNGDGRINPNDMTIIGNPHPKLIYGFNLRLSYRSFDFTAFLQGNYGNDLYLKYRPTLDNHESLYHSWRPDRRDARLPLLDHRDNFSGQGTSSYYVQDGSYLRGKSVILGYTLPAAVLKKVGVEKARIYLQGVNLFTITSFQGADPAIAQFNPGSNIVGGGVATADWIIGMDPGRYALARTVLLGINLGF
jgi:TonB-linked SusC/RagA family outer membrane protein